MRHIEHLAILDDMLQLVMKKLIDVPKILIVAGPNGAGKTTLEKIEKEETKNIEEQTK